MRRAAACILLAPAWMVAQSCVLPGFTNVEGGQDAGAGAEGGSGSGATAASGDATATSTGEGGSAGATDAGSSDSSSGDDCPEFIPEGLCSVGSGVCSYPRLKAFCECPSEMSNWHCETCPQMQPLSGNRCYLETMFCEYGEAPDIFTCSCLDDGGLTWNCEVA